MVAGRGPFDHVRSERTVLSAHAGEKPQPPSYYAKQPIPPDLDRVLLCALRKEPTDRFQTATDFRQQLERIQEQLERGLRLLDAAAYDAEWFAQQERSSEGEPVPIPRSGAFPKHVGPALPPHSQRPISHLQVALIFLSALAVTAATSAGLIALLQGAR
jgi:hypothetical protein